MVDCLGFFFPAEALSKIAVCANSIEKAGLHCDRGRQVKRGIEALNCPSFNWYIKIFTLDKKTCLVIIDWHFVGCSVTYSRLLSLSGVSLMWNEGFLLLLSSTCAYCVWLMEGWLNWPHQYTAPKQHLFKLTCPKLPIDSADIPL